MTDVTPATPRRPAPASRQHRLMLGVLIAIAVGLELRTGRDGADLPASVIGHAGGLAMIGVLAVAAVRIRTELIERAQTGTSGHASFTAAERLTVALAAPAAQLLVLYLAFVTLGNGTSVEEFRSTFVERFTNHGDSEHYLYLAEHGYSAEGEKSNLLVFFPLYPLLIAAGELVTGSYVASALLISWLCWAAASVSVLELAARYLDRPRAALATGLLVLYPFSFFSLGIYTESLFLLLSAQCMLRAERRQWGAAGVLGCLAATCRPQGLVLLVPTAYLWLRDARARTGAPAGAALLLIPGGYGIYLALNRVVAGDWFAYLDYQQAAPWYQSTEWIGVNLAQHVAFAEAHPGLAPFIYVPQLVLYGLAMLGLGYALLVRAPMQLVLWGAAYVGLTYLAGWMISGPRYMFGCLPLFLLAAYPRHPWWQRIIPVACAVLLTQYSVLYLQGQSIF